MKKQIQRFTQQLQTISRSDKSDLVTEDLQAKEKNVDAIKLSCYTTVKKIQGLMSGNEGMPEDKRAKKIPENILGNSMIESTVYLGEKSIMKDLLAKCGNMEINLGYELMQHEIEVEKEVLQPLNLVEAESNNIMKARRKLDKLKQELDSATSRYLAAQRQVNSGGNATKIDGLKEEKEEAHVKVEQSLDSWAADIYTFLAKESEFAKLILQFAKCQRNYHRAALGLLEQNLPILEDMWQEHVQKPVFGCDLEVHLTVTKRTIALPIEICVCTLYEAAMNEEGLFRIAGGASKVRKFRAALDAGIADLGFALELHDVHIVAGTLKSYLRELPDPLFSHVLYEDWVNSVKSSDLDCRRNALRDVIQRLPETRRNNIRYLIKFFHELSRHQEHNKMTPQNLAIVLAPSLLWSPANGGDVFGLSALANTHASIIEHLISHSDWFFPEEIEYFVTFPRIALPTPTTHSQHIQHSAGSLNFPSNGDWHGEHVAREDEKGHRRLGSYDGVVELRNCPPSGGNTSEGSSSKIDSPRPASRKKNKPAPIPPGMATPGGADASTRSPMLAKTPDKEERKAMVCEGVVIIETRVHDKPSLPPTGPDSRRLSSFEKRPVLAPRPSVNPLAERTASQPTHSSAAPIGFESIESELKSKVARREQSVQQQSANQKSDDEMVGESKRVAQSTSNKKISGGDSAQPATPNPTHHPNAVPLFGFHAPIPTERSKFDSTDGKIRPSIPDRPNSIRIQGASPSLNASQDQSPGDGRSAYPPVLERIHSFSVNKQQVSIVQVNQSSTPLSLNSSDHPDIQYADSEDIPPTNENQSRPAHAPVYPTLVDTDDALSTTVDVSFTASAPVCTSGPNADSAAKPERPPKPERLNHPPNCIESNNNKRDSEEEPAAICSPPPAPVNVAASSTPPMTATLPRPTPTPRPQPPIPPAKPRNASTYGSGSMAESTDF